MSRVATFSHIHNTLLHLIMKRGERELRGRHTERKMDSDRMESDVYKRVYKRKAEEHEEKRERWTTIKAEKEQKKDRQTLREETGERKRGGDGD